MQRFKCLNCNQWFVKSDKSAKEKYSAGAALSPQNILIDHLDGISYRRMENRRKIDKKKLCNTVNEEIAKLANNLEITKYFFKQLNYSGNLVVDGKYIPVKEDIEIYLPFPGKGKIPKSKKRRKALRGKVAIWGTDYSTHDILHYEFGDSENCFVLNNYFLQLKNIGYQLKSVTADDKKEIIQAAKRYYPNCVPQLCVRHYMAKISRILAIGNIKIQINAKEKQIDALFDGSGAYLPPTRYWSIGRAVKLANEIAEQEFKYELLLDFQDIIESILFAENYKIAQYRTGSLEKYFWPKKFKMREMYSGEHIKTVKKLITDFREHKEYLLNYLKYPHLNIPGTTNIMEGYNSQLELRLNSIKGFEGVATAENYINAWILKRRFSKFTDCKKQFKNLNGKTPLECANADISNIQNWIDFCQNLFK